MKSPLLRVTACLALASGLALSPLAMPHFDDKEVMQSYRQSWFAMVAANFGPMVATIKGEIPWDDARMTAYAKQLSTLANMDISRGFSPGTDKGTTRAKPEIWENMDDFNKKMTAMREATGMLEAAVASGDRREVLKGVAATGESCKACHDEYKSENYLY
jgi:cytochrome c556